MRIVCHPGRLEGSVRAIPSKSDAHRMLICAALADRPTEVVMPNWQGEDITATMRCLQALGASFEQREDRVIVVPIGEPVQNATLDCGESGSTLRFLLPVAAALGCGAHFTGTGRLPQRPIGPLLSALRAGGVTFDADILPLRMKGKLRAGAYMLPGDISSQFITGLLLALPAVGGGSIGLLHALESAGYVDMTVSALSKFSVSVAQTGQGFVVHPGQGYRSPGVVAADGDWSNMAFFLCAGALGGAVRCEGLFDSSLQGDAAVAEWLARFGAQVTRGRDAASVSGCARSALAIDVRAIPDLVPILAVVAAGAPGGVTRFYNAARLRLKESDRIASVARMLHALGGKAWEEPDALYVEGGVPLRGGVVECCGDHRIAMAGAIAALICREATILDGAEAVNKSYPSFFEEYQKLGGVCHVVHHG